MVKPGPSSLKLRSANYGGIIVFCKLSLLGTKKKVLYLLRACGEAWSWLKSMQTLGKRNLPLKKLMFTIRSNP